MSLGGDTLTTWDQMKRVFLDKYKYYLKTKDRGGELFKTIQK